MMRRNVATLPDSTPRLGRHRARGFTLIEIMVVIVILGVLAALVVPKIMSRPDEARIVAARQDISFASARTNGSVFIGMDTIAGPVYFALGLNDDGGSAYYLFLGRTF